MVLHDFVRCRLQYENSDIYNYLMISFDFDVFRMGTLQSQLLILTHTNIGYPSSSTALFGEDSLLHNAGISMQTQNGKVSGWDMDFVSHSYRVTQCRDQFQSMPQSSILKHSHRGFVASPFAWNKELIAAFCFTGLPPRRLPKLRFLCSNLKTMCIWHYISHWNILHVTP